MSWDRQVCIRQVGIRRFHIVLSVIFMREPYQESRVVMGWATRGQGNCKHDLGATGQISI